MRPGPAIPRGTALGTSVRGAAARRSLRLLAPQGAYFRFSVSTQWMNPASFSSLPGEANPNF